MSEVEVPTVVDRLRAAGISEQRIAEHLSARRSELDGEVVTDPDHPASASARIVLAGS